MNEISAFDRLTGALIGLARTVIENEIKDDEAYKILLEGLCLTRDESSDALEAQIEMLHAVKHRLAPNCSTCASPCGRTSDQDMEQFYGADDVVCEMRKEVLTQLHEAALRVRDVTSDSDLYAAAVDMICESLFKLGYEDDVQQLMVITEKTRSIAVK